MHFLEYHYNNIIKYDFLNKFHKTPQLAIPKIKKISLTFNCKHTDLKELFSAFFALELVTMQKAIFIKSKKPQVSVKIKKNEFVGCKLILRKRYISLFMEKLFYKVFPKIKQFEGLRFKINKVTKSFDFLLQNPFYFSELEQHYKFFQALPPVKVSIVTNSESSFQTFFLLLSYRFPLFK